MRKISSGTVGIILILCRCCKDFVQSKTIHKYCCMHIIENTHRQPGIATVQDSFLSIFFFDNKTIELHLELIHFYTFMRPSFNCCLNQAYQKCRSFRVGNCRELNYRAKYTRFRDEYFHYIATARCSDHLTIPSYRAIFGTQINAFKELINVFFIIQVLL